LKRGMQVGSTLSIPVFTVCKAYLRLTSLVRTIFNRQEVHQGLLHQAYLLSWKRPGSLPLYLSFLDSDSTSFVR
jgi:hypothetical protein